MEKPINIDVTINGPTIDINMRLPAYPYHYFEDYTGAHAINNFIKAYINFHYYGQPSHKINAFTIRNTITPIANLLHLLHVLGVNIK